MEEFLSVASYEARAWMCGGRKGRPTGCIWLGRRHGRASGVFLSLADFSSRGLLLFFIIAPRAKVTNGSHSPQTGVDASGLGSPRGGLDV